VTILWFSFNSYIPKLYYYAMKKLASSSISGSFSCFLTHLGDKKVGTRDKAKKSDGSHIFVRLKGFIFVSCTSYPISCLSQFHFQSCSPEILCVTSNLIVRPALRLLPILYPRLSLFEVLNLFFSQNFGKSRYRSLIFNNFD